MKKAFTLIELMVAVGILGIVLSFAGVVFNAGIDTYRTAEANAEIMRNFRAITDRLDADFEGLRKDGEIFVVWVAKPTAVSGDCDLDGFERFDRIMFFADGDFQSYGTTPMIHGNTARISYMLAIRGGMKADAQARPQRILARTQHILTSDPGVPWSLDPNTFTDTDSRWLDWHNRYEYDKTPPLGASLEQWKHISWDQKADMLSVITDVDITPSSVASNLRGAHVDPADPTTIHKLLCEGVGEFKVQGWYDAESRWVPEIDVDGDGDLTDRTDFYWSSPGVLDPLCPGMLYPGIPYGGIGINGISYTGPLDETNFNSIPGLGRALKFTFTLFDSKGIIEQGRTFTHIVYLDK
ncbi:MAG: type II secretion system protein [Sedimentisphaerales bacterium]|nr:type II secretion system protein [Sedimentisphaerales bacterium]